MSVESSISDESTTRRLYRCRPLYSYTGRLADSRLLPISNHASEYCKDCLRLDAFALKKVKVDHAPVWSVGGVLISLSVAVEPVGGG